MAEGRQRMQRRETRKAEKGQGAKDLEMHTQKFDLLSDGTWVIIGQQHLCIFYF